MKKIVKLYITIVLCILTIIFTSFSTYANQYRETTNLDNIDENRYPGYKEQLKALKSIHPNWSFTLFYTGLNWDTVVMKETTDYHGRSLIQDKYGEWLCSSCGEKVYDGSNWRCASAKAVSYYLDPRNFLNENNIFQFETLSYVDGMYSEAGVEAILSGTFMSNRTIRDYYNNGNYTDKKFSTVIIEAGQENGVNPYHLASRIKQEIVKSGGVPSNSVTGSVSEYEGYYNFYNIGATSGSGAIERGLKYAKTKEWSSPEIAIKGGANIIATNYIAKGQNTLYLQKFDVDDSDNKMYSHQYQQNIQAPSSEGRRIYNNTYSALQMLNNSFNFVIPVYENMPSSVSPLPRDGILVGEIMRVIANGSLTLREQPTTNSNSITSLVTGSLVQRLEQNVANANGYIWDKVKTGDGRIGYVASKYLQFVENTQADNNIVRDTANISVDEESKNVNCTPSVNIEFIINSNPGKNVVVKKADGTEVTDTNTKIGTGMEIIIGDTSYTAVKYGDVSGDGEINSADLLKVVKKLKGKTDLNGAWLRSADCNNDGQLNSADLLKIVKYLKGTGTITI